jgi:hypothetical protein
VTRRLHFAGCEESRLIAEMGRSSTSPAVRDDRVRWGLAELDGKHQLSPVLLPLAVHLWKSSTRKQPLFPARR